MTSEAIHVRPIVRAPGKLANLHFKSTQTLLVWEILYASEMSVNCNLEAREKRSKTIGLKYGGSLRASAFQMRFCRNRFKLLGANSCIHYPIWLLIVMIVFANFIFTCATQSVELKSRNLNLNESFKSLSQKRWSIIGPESSQSMRQVALMRQQNDQDQDDDRGDKGLTKRRSKRRNERKYRARIMAISWS